LPLVSKIDVPILGAVNVLFVKVCVPVSVTVPAVANDISLILGLVPSFAVAKTNLSPLSVAEKVTPESDPDAYLNCTVYAPEVEFLKKKMFEHLKVLLQLDYQLLNQ
jgi:hypothetical protein